MASVDEIHLDRLVALLLRQRFGICTPSCYRRRRCGRRRRFHHHLLRRSHCRRRRRCCCSCRHSWRAMLLPAGKTPLVDTSQAEGFNMSVLKRMDEDILEILYSATHVAVYEFDTTRKSWKRSDIEGTLFLVKRCSAPRFRMIVVNSKRIDNFMEEVDGSLECEVLQTFLLYTRGNNQLYGIWFYDEKNCEEFGNYLKRIVKGMPKASPSGTPTIREKVPAAGEKPRPTTDLRNELQSMFHQLNGQQQQNGTACSSSAQPNSGASSSGQKSIVTTGENDHLMRLFRQAQERSPPTSCPLAATATTAAIPAAPPPPPPPPVSTELPPHVDVVLSLDHQTPIANPTPRMDPGPSVPPSVSAVPLVPLPPDFFKPSSRATTLTAVVNGGEDIHPLTPAAVAAAAAPDPVHLPLPLSEAMGITATTAAAVPIATKDMSLLMGGGVESNGMMGDGDPVAYSLARFFAENKQEGSIAESVRERFRQALVNLLSNDEILDLLIAEFKKVGIPIQ